jgi:hypothetical protein
MTEDRLSHLMNSIGSTIQYELVSDIQAGKISARKCDYLLEVSEDVYQKIISDSLIDQLTTTIQMEFGDVRLCGVEVQKNINLKNNTYILTRKVLYGNYDEVEE